MNRAIPMDIDLSLIVPAIHGFQLDFSDAQANSLHIPISVLIYNNLGADI